MTKICTKCKIEKPKKSFYKDRRLKCGLSSRCKSCLRQWQIENLAHVREMSRKWYIENKKRKEESVKKWKSANPEKVKENQKGWVKDNKVRIRENVRVWYAQNGERIRGVKKKWVAANIDAERERYRKNRSTPKGRLSHCVGGSMRNSLKALKGGRHWETLVGFTLLDLMQHLEKQFLPGMSWDNHGTFWHIDHRIPISVFNYKVPEDFDFARCWSLENLRPLEASKNISKGAKISSPFQPSLLLREVENG